MLREFAINIPKIEESIGPILNYWRKSNSKIVVMRAEIAEDDVLQFYDEVLPKIGTPSLLAEDVSVGDRAHQRVEKIWMEVRYDPRFPDAYRHSQNAQPLHTDGSYIPSFPNATLMICVSNSAIGGESVFLDGRDLVHCLKEENPEFLEALTSTIVPHARSGDRREAPIIEVNSEGVNLNWNYYCVDPAAGKIVSHLARKFHKYLEDSAAVKQKVVSFKLGPGDAVFWKDCEVLHGRNAFRPTRVSERFMWKCCIDVGVF